MHPPVRKSAGAAEGAEGLAEAAGSAAHGPSLQLRLRAGESSSQCPRDHGGRRRRRRAGTPGRRLQRDRQQTRCHRGPSVAVRETADGAHRPSPGANPVRHTSVDTATQRSTATQGDTRRDREKRPASYENSQLAGRLRRWWQVLGSNQRRLSRRFYSPSLLPEVHTADQHIRRSRHDRGPPPSAMRPWAPGLVHGRGRKTHGRGRWERLHRPSAWFCASDLAFQDACALSSSSSSPGWDSGWVSWVPIDIWH